MIVPRDYQAWAVHSVFDYFGTNVGNPLVAMPTGTGKSVVIALALERMFRTYSRSRVMVLTHVKELIAQNYAKLLEVWPTAPAGVYSAGLNKKESQHPITFAGIASVAKKANLFGFIDILFIDEAHLVNPTEATMYNNFITALKAYNPALKVVGLTATPWRLGHGKITEGGLFTDVCCDMTGVQPFNWLIDQGYLLPLIPRQTRSMLDTNGVHMRGGEFIASELQSAVDKHHITEAALRETMELGHDRHSWLIFCAGVQHAEHVAEMLTQMGVPCEAVHSEMKGDRDRILEDFKSGKLRAVANNNVLTTGFDHPGLDLIVMLRPTASAVLWVQMLGRGTRPLFAPGFDLTTQEGRLASIASSAKRDCLVLDFANNTRKLGPINDPLPPRKKGEKGGDAPVKLCEACSCWNHASLRACAYCGSPFPEVHLKIKANASTEALVKKVKAEDNPVVDVFKVDHLTYGMHNSKDAGTPMVKVTYYCGLRSFHEFVCIQHEGFAKHKAAQWWKKRTTLPMPPTTMEALAIVDKLSQPTHLSIWANKKFPEILDTCFDGTAFGKQAPEGVVTPVQVHAPQVPAPAPATPVPQKTGLVFDMDDDIPF
jgi:DNA repair protein RadD